ncbi:sugar ABC transporter substrate-binding protein [Acidothermaceae bacterium B102]|nr:sugar ABC transporter substrate-binding protein [Acidothermaceae bacterium B102]
MASSAGWQTVKLDIGSGPAGGPPGTGTPQTITVTGPPHIAYFPAGNENNYLTIRGAALNAAVAKIPGATVTTFNADWDATKQLNMIQSAITSKKFNAFVVDTDDGPGECKILTTTAPAANIAVVDLSGPICGLSSKPNGRDQVANGTIGAVGNNSILAVHDYLKYMIKNNPGPQKVIVVTGPPLHPLTPEIDAALALIKSEDPQFQIVANVSTDFSTLQGQQKTAPLLVAHPDATIIFSAYADITVGALTAIKAAGKSGKIKVYDQFGSKAIVADIKSGTVAATTGGYPAGSAQAGIEMIRLAFQGKQGPRIQLGDGGPVPADASTWNGVNIIDKTNVDQYNPQF